MKYFSATVLVLSLFLSTQANHRPQEHIKAPSYHLQKNDTAFSVSCIVLGSAASSSEQWAAAELQRWLHEIGGQYLPILHTDSPPEVNKIMLGYSQFVQDATGEAAPGEYDESFHYFSKGENIFIYGGRQRGTMYGVMAFLENEFGCRWYTPLVSVIPKRSQLLFGSYDHRESPGIRVRNDFYFEAFDPQWAARNRMNGRLEFSDQPAVQPGGVESYWAVHTFYPLMPPEEFFDKHPEYYSLINGKRTHDRAQLCLSNAAVLKIMTERVKKQMREHPQYRIYCVSQNDWYNPCQCNRCQALVKKFGTESGIMIWFVNQVAEAVEKEFPDKFIGTLAYQYTRKPPANIHPRQNVVVRLCPIEACVAHSLESCPQNKSFLDDMQTWAAISPHLYIWDYVVNFGNYITPYPNFAVLQPNIKTFRDNKSIGIMEQAAYQSRGGEFSELKAYLIAKLLWNPECNTEEVINDFMYGYYGRAGKYIQQYFNMLQGLVTPDTHIHIGLKANDKIFNDKFIDSASVLFNNAIIVAENETMLSRVKLASLQLLYLKCLRHPVASRNDGTYHELLEITRKEGITYFAEDARSMERFKKFMEKAD